MTCEACHGTGRVPWYGRPVTCPWCLGGGARDGAS
jgi:DnaJ-class molecular chaperone